MSSPPLRPPGAPVVTGPRVDVAAPGVVVSGLGVRYGQLRAVDGLSLEAPAGGVTALLGPNGAGKSSTVECCVGLRRPDAGEVKVLGLDPVQDARALRPRVGVMLQDGGLPSGAPAGQVLRHIASMYGRPRAVPELAERLGIDRFARTTVRRLSGGERQRLALATAVVGQPEVVFLDEPSAGLDPQARNAVWELISELRTGGTTIVLTTHQMGEAEVLADHVVIVDHGSVLAAGSVSALVGDSTTMAVTPGPGIGLADACAGLQASLDRRPGAVVGSSQVRVTPDGRLEVAGADVTALLSSISGWAQAAGVTLTSVTTGRRSLEDVFLDLTGRTLR